MLGCIFICPFICLISSLWQQRLSRFTYFTLSVCIPAGFPCQWSFSEPHPPRATLVSPPGSRVVGSEVSTVRAQNFPHLQGSEFVCVICHQVFNCQKHEKADGCNILWKNHTRVLSPTPPIDTLSNGSKIYVNKETGHSTYQWRNFTIRYHRNLRHFFRR